MKKTSKRECLEDLRMLHWLPPYNTQMNYVAHDNYFAASIRQDYDEKLLRECEDELGVHHLK